MKLREKMFALAENGQRPEAIALCKNELLPAYHRYKEAGDKLFEYNMRQGKDRGETIMRLCTVTQFVVAGIGMLIFILGFLIGMSR